MAFTLSNQATTWLSDRRWKPLETNQNPLSNLLGICGKWFESSRSLTKLKAFGGECARTAWRQRKISPNVSVPHPALVLSVIPSWKLLNTSCFFCSLARVVWFGCNIQILNESGYLCSAIKWTSEICESLPASEACEFLSSVAFTAWFIWKGRNAVIFRYAKVD